MTTYPLLEIILYLSLLLSPPDANRITITGPGLNDNSELRITVTGWAIIRDGAESPIAIARNGLCAGTAAKPKFTQLGAYLGPLQKGHDWTREPKLALADSTTLEKVDAGYVFRRSDDEGVNTQAYTIVYHRPDPADMVSVITVNVIGMVNNPGTYRLARGATLLDAITAAGGVNRLSVRRQTRLVRDAGTDKTQTFTIDLEKLQRTPEKAMILEDNDCIFVPERIF